MADRHSSPLVLASASPRRQELLTLLGLPFEVVAPSVDERLLLAETPEAAVLRLALAKGAAVRALRPQAVIIAADTLVAVGTQILGKPKDIPDARRMLGALAATTHDVWTGVAVSSKERILHDVARTRVRFRAIAPSEVEGYLATSEPLDKAGAYAIQGRAAVFCESIEGEYSNVVGLPLCLLVNLLARHGLRPDWVR